MDHGQVDRSLFLCSYVARFEIIWELSYKMFNGIIEQKYFSLQKNIYLNAEKYFLRQKNISCIYWPVWEEREEEESPRQPECHPPAD